MSKVDIQDYQAAIQEEFKEAVHVSLLGGTQRRNSYTFKVENKTGAPVVVKVLKKHKGTESKINDEKQSLKQIEQIPNIKVSRLVSSGELKVRSKKMSYLVFPYYEGPTVHELASKGKKCSEEEVKLFITALGGTILQLAKAGIIHQDIKPDNIIRQKDGEYILLDLGISRFTALEASFVKQQGPAAFLSMEQVQLGTHKSIVNQRRISFLSDLNSLGIVAIKMLLGEDFMDAWEVDRRPEAADRVKDGEIVQIQNKDLRELISSLLEPTPSRRLLMLKDSFDIANFCSAKTSNTKYWSLHKSTGLNFLKSFAKENDYLNLGLVLSAETIQSPGNALQVVESLLDNEWEVAVDPSTHKLLYNQDHHAYLKDRQYYYDDLVQDRFFDTSFTKTFASQVIEFQRSLKPTIYISPYFFIKRFDDQLITIGLSLHEECRKQLNKLGDNKELALGLSVSKGMLESAGDIDGLADQLVLNKSIGTIYLNLELMKRDSSPCKDMTYLRGVKRLVQLLACTKNVIVSQIDQASLGLLTLQRVSLAINPSTSFRKNDIDEKMKDEKEDRGGGPKAKDKRHRIYIPRLFNDLDITRDLNDVNFSRLDKSLNITNSANSPYYKASMNLSDSEARNKHFTYEFNQQVIEISAADSNTSRQKLKNLLKEAKETYSELQNSAIKLDGDQTAEFLSVWEKVFL